jgi:hypothetical protein
MVRIFTTITNDSLQVTVTDSLKNTEEIHTIKDVESYRNFIKVIESGKVPWFDRNTRISNSSSINWASSETDNQFVIDIVDYIFHDGERPKTLKG